VPVIVVVLIRELEIKEAHLTDGIFRECGSTSKIVSIQNFCEEQGALLRSFDAIANEVNFTVHDVANILKRYIRDLPSPLLTDGVASSLANVPKADLNPANVGKILKSLPRSNFKLMCTLCCYLNKVRTHVAENMMNSTNITTCILPSLTTSHPSSSLLSAFVYLLDNYDAVFENAN